MLLILHVKHRQYLFLSECSVNSNIIAYPGKKCIINPPLHPQMDVVY